MWGGGDPSNFIYSYMVYIIILKDTDINENLLQPHLVLFFAVSIM